MSSLSFTKAPSPPEGVNDEDWNKEWIGLFVGLASAFPLSVGYLGDELSSVCYKNTALSLLKEQTAEDSMDTMTNILEKTMWVSRESLISSCKNASPRRSMILAWLEQEPQKYREMFAVPESMAEYKP